MTIKYLKEQYNLHEGNWSRHLGNVLELEKSLKQIQSELNYELQQEKFCKEQMDKFSALLSECQEKEEIK